MKYWKERRKRYPNPNQYNPNPNPKAHWWESSNVFAGTDSSKRNNDHTSNNKSIDGTWMGITKNGRVSFITNVRQVPDLSKRSRGVLVRDYLLSMESSMEYTTMLIKDKHLFNGYNLVVSDLLNDNPDGGYYFGNQSGQLSPMPLKKGIIYGMSNANTLLSKENDSSQWPKVRLGISILKTILDQFSDDREKLLDAIMETLLENSEIPSSLPYNPSADQDSSDSQLPETCLRDCIFVKPHVIPELHPTKVYGTRTHTVILVDWNNHVTFVEQDSSDSSIKLENRIWEEFDIDIA